LVQNKVERRSDRLVVALEENVRLAANDEMRITVHA